MYVVIGDQTYRQLKSVSFAPETSVIGTTVPINQFSVDIETEENAPEVGQYASLYDDRGNIWAKYWLVFAEHIDVKTIRLTAQSTLKLLERDMLDPMMCENVPAITIIDSLFQSLGQDAYEIDPSFAEETISGYFPKQSAKTRLQWVCFVLLAYVKTYFTDKVEIKRLSEEVEATIPIEKTFWKPSYKYSDYVTGIRIVTYAYTRSVPGVTDKWVEDEQGNVFVQTQAGRTLTNPDAPEGILSHVISFEDVTIVNDDNFDKILEHLGKYYFKRATVDLQAINNAEFMPGQRVTGYADETIMFEGYAEKFNFEFGLQARSSIHITPVDLRETYTVTFIYRYEGMQIGMKTYNLPMGYIYDFEMPYTEWYLNGHKYVFMPTIRNVHVEVTGGIQVFEIPYVIALDYVINQKELHVLSVNESSKEGESVTLL